MKDNRGRPLRWIVVYEILPYLRERGLDAYVYHGTDVRIRSDHDGFIVLYVNPNMRKGRRTLVLDACTFRNLDIFAGKDGSLIVEKEGARAYQNFLGSIVT